MNGKKTRFFLIKIGYWLGIAADALWAIGLLFPQVFGILAGRPDFNPDLQNCSTYWIFGRKYYQYLDYDQKRNIIHIYGNELYTCRKDGQRKKTAAYTNTFTIS